MFLPMLYIRNISLRIKYRRFVTNYYCYGLKVIIYALGVIQLWFKISEINFKQRVFYSKFYDRVYIIAIHNIRSHCCGRPITKSLFTFVIIIDYQRYVLGLCNLKRRINRVYTSTQ